MLPNAGLSPLLEGAVAWLRADGFVAYPTETVWGLGACANRPRAIDRLVRWKGREEDAPLSVLVSSPEAAMAIGCELTAGSRRLMDAFWPGPLMLVVPCGGEWAPGVARSDGALGIRCSPHPLAAALVTALEAASLGPLTSTSLNRSGEPAATNASEAARLAEANADRTQISAPFGLFFEGVDAGGAAPSTVVDCTRDRIEILRAGEVSAERIERVWAESK